MASPMASTYDYVKLVLTSAPGKWFCVACLPAEVRTIGGHEDHAVISEAVAKLSAMPNFQRTPRASANSVSCGCGRDGYGSIRFRGNG